MTKELATEYTLMIVALDFSFVYRHSLSHFPVCTFLDACQDESDTVNHASCEEAESIKAEGEIGVLDLQVSGEF